MKKIILCVAILACILMPRGGQINGKIKVTVISDYGNNEFYINEGECFNYTEYLQDDSLFFCGLFYDELYINRYSGIPLEEDICLYACYYSPQDLDYFSTESIGITTRIYELDIDNLDCYKLFDGDEFCTAFYPKLSIDDFEELKRFDGRIGLAWIFRYENRSIKKEYLDENGIPYYKVLFYFIFNEEKTPVEVLRIVNEINSLSNYEAKVDPLVYPD